MNLVFYITSLEKGGAERVISNLANYFSQKHSVTLVLDIPVIKYEINDAVKIITLKENADIIKNKKNFITRKFRYIGYFFKLKKIFNKIKPDMIISFLSLPAFMALLTRNKGSKVVISVRNDPKTEYTTVLKKILMRFLYPKADGFVFQTQDAQNYFKNIISCKQTIIYNAVTDEFINFDKQGKKQKRIVAVGRLHEQKNYPLLIESYSEISRNFPDYDLVIYGDGPEKENIIKIIDQYKLNEKVILAGNVDNLKEEIYNASLYVMTSKFEGMPNSLIEAMVLGLPVISTDCPCGGPKELIINYKNGILVGLNDKFELIKAMNDILSNQDLATSLGNEAKKIIEIVNPKAIYSKWEDFINIIIDNKM